MAQLNYVNLNLCIGALNVNSFNVSTLGSRNKKNIYKNWGCNKREKDVLFISDCRFNDKSSDITRMMGLNKNASYKLYYNSNIDSRGVAIAIKRQIVHEILEEFHSRIKIYYCWKLKLRGVI